MEDFQMERILIPKSVSDKRASRNGTYTKSGVTHKEEYYT